MKNTPEYVVIHTAAHGDARHNHDTSAAQIDNWHRARGWRGIGYHYVVRLDGRIETGRPEAQSGAHCRQLRMNYRSLGVCFSGHGDFHAHTPNQREAGLRLVRGIIERYRIPAEHVIGHREAGANKTCPGVLVDMDGFRRQLGGGASSPPATSMALDMFAAICALFDDPGFKNLPRQTRRLILDLRRAEPFAALTRADLGEGSNT